MTGLHGTGGNRFIPADAGCADLMRSINDQLGDIRAHYAEDGEELDVGGVTISTDRIGDGRISVTVMADGAPKPHA